MARTRPHPGVVTVCGLLFLICGCHGTSTVTPATHDTGVLTQTHDTGIHATQDVGVQPDTSTSSDLGASGGDATTRPDAADAGADAADASTPDRCAAALFCDDFEGRTVGQPPGGPWTTQENGGTVTVDDTRAYDGSHAVKFTTDGNNGSYKRAYMSIDGAPIFPVPNDTFFGRMMVWLDAAPSGSVHWTNIQAEGPVPNQSYTGIYRYGGQVDGKLMANYETSGASSDCWQHSQTVIPTQRWACFEWKYDGTNDQMRFWLDGQALDDLSVDGQGMGCIGHDTGDKWFGPTFQTLRLGWEHYQATGPITMWIDDVAVDTSRLGCP